MRSNDTQTLKLTVYTALSYLSGQTTSTPSFISGIFEREGQANARETRIATRGWGDDSLSAVVLPRGKRHSQAPVCPPR